MARKILTILGHPRTGSLCASLADCYVAGATQAGADIRLLRIADLVFNWATPGDAGLEPGLEPVQHFLRWADHVTLVYPIWWGAAPGQLRTMLERVLQPGFAYKYRSRGMGWDRLLAGRTSELLVTMDTPSLYYRLVHGGAGDRVMAKRTLAFCGIDCVRITHFSPVRTASPDKRKKWLEKAAALGASAAG
jgi:NAD(P)H dehydrogenase (quinone)